MKQWQKHVVAAHKRGYRVLVDGRLLNPKKKQLTISRSSKYPIFGVWLEGRVCGIPVHKFAAYCFYGKAALRAPCVRHLNGNRYDVRKRNLALGTYSDNEYDKPAAVRKRSTKIAARSTVRFEKYQKRQAGCKAGFKICSECMKPKPVEQFGPHKRSADGLRYRCQPCLAERERKRRAA